jgi:hypothetical protein
VVSVRGLPGFPWPPHCPVSTCHSEGTSIRSLSLGTDGITARALSQEKRVDNAPFNSGHYLRLMHRPVISNPARECDMGTDDGAAQSHSLRRARSSADPCAVWPLASTRQHWMRMQRSLVSSPVQASRLRADLATSVWTHAIDRSRGGGLLLPPFGSVFRASYSTLGGGVADSSRNAHDGVQQQRRSLRLQIEQQ